MIPLENIHWMDFEWTAIILPTNKDMYNVVAVEEKGGKKVQVFC